MLVNAAQYIVEAILGARRPALIVGGGVNDARAVRALLSRLKLPLLVTWAARALLPEGDSFGTHGSRSGNFTVQSADLVLALGTRLDTKATGTPASSFAPGARLLMVDIDANELGKMNSIGRELHFALRQDANALLVEMLNTASWMKADYDTRVWFAQVAAWRRQYAPEMQATMPYSEIRELSNLSSSEDVIVSDTGCVVAWMMQAFRFRGQRFVHAFNNTPMGYGVPAAVGAAFATGRRVVLVTGDGGLGVNLNEFATIAKHSLNVKTILFNNRGHAMCRQTQTQWLGSVYDGTSEEGGLAVPNYSAIAAAYGIKISPTMSDLFCSDGPAFCELVIPFDARVEPMVRFGRSLEYADPEIEGVDAILTKARAL